MLKSGKSLLHLLQGLGLCHGISGNAYALLAVWKLTKEDVWRRRALQFALFAADKWRALADVPDARLSLYEGMAGVVAVWYDLLQPEGAST